MWCPGTIPRDTHWIPQMSLIFVKASDTFGFNHKLKSHWNHSIFARDREWSWAVLRTQNRSRLWVESTTQPQTHTSTPRTYSMLHCKVIRKPTYWKKSSAEKLSPSSWQKWQLQLLFWPQPPSIYSVNLPAMSLIAGFLKQLRGSSASRRISEKIRSSLPFKKVQSAN